MNREHDAKQNDACLHVDLLVNHDNGWVGVQGVDATGDDGQRCRPYHGVLQEDEEQQDVIELVDNEEVWLGVLVEWHESNQGR